MPITTVSAQSAALFHALSDQTRLAIVDRLRSGERCVCDLTDLLDAAQSRLSFHLKVLRESGLVDCRRDGKWAYYWLRPEAFDLIEQTTDALRPTPGAVASQKAKCCA